MVEEEKKRHQAGRFEGLGDELGESLHGYKGDSNENQSQLLPNDMMEIATQDETFEDIAIDLGISIEEHERLDIKEAEQEIRRLSHEERAKLLAEQERLQEQQEAELLAKEREQQLRAQVLKEKEEQQREKMVSSSSDNNSIPLAPLVIFLFMLCLIGAIGFSGVGSSNSSSLDRLDEARASFSREIANTHFPINEAKYTLAEGETIYPWTLDEFKTILVPDLPIGGYSNLTLDDFVAKYGLASEVDYQKSSDTIDSVTLTYTLSETEFLTFNFIYYNSGYQISFKQYEGFENTPLIDYWKDKTGKTWSLSDYHSLSEKSTSKTGDGQSLEEIITTFGAPTSYESSVLGVSWGEAYQTTLQYHLEDGTTIHLNFSSETNEVSSYYLSSYSIETEKEEEAE